MVAKPSENWITTDSFTMWPCNSLPSDLSYHNNNILLSGQLATKVKIKPLSTGFKYKPTL